MTSTDNSAARTGAPAWHNLDRALDKLRASGQPLFEDAPYRRIGFSGYQDLRGLMQNHAVIAARHLFMAARDKAAANDFVYDGTNDQAHPFMMAKEGFNWLVRSRNAPYADGTSAYLGLGEQGIAPLWASQSVSLAGHKNRFVRDNIKHLDPVTAIGHLIDAGDLITSLNGESLDPNYCGMPGDELMGIWGDCAAGALKTLNQRQQAQVFRPHIRSRILRRMDLLLNLFSDQTDRGAYMASIGLEHGRWRDAVIQTHETLLRQWNRRFDENPDMARHGRHIAARIDWLAFAPGSPMGDGDVNILCEKLRAPAPENIIYSLMQNAADAYARRGNAENGSAVTAFRDLYHARNLYLEVQEDHAENEEHEQALERQVEAITAGLLRYAPHFCESAISRASDPALMPREVLGMLADYKAGRSLFQEHDLPVDEKQQAMYRSLREEACIAMAGQMMLPMQASLDRENMRANALEELLEILAEANLTATSEKVQKALGLKDGSGQSLYDWQVENDLVLHAHKAADEEEGMPMRIAHALNAMLIIRDRNIDMNDPDWKRRLDADEEMPFAKLAPAIARQFLKEQLAEAKALKPDDETLPRYISNAQSAMEILDITPASGDIVFFRAAGMSVATYEILQERADASLTRQHDAPQMKEGPKGPSIP